MENLSKTIYNLQRDLKEYEAEPFGPLPCFEGTTSIVDFRRYGLPAITKADTNETINRNFELLIERFAENPELATVNLATRYVWGDQLPHPKTFASATALEVLWSHATNYLFGNSRIEIEDTRYPDVITLGKVIDAFFLNPEIPITIIAAHGFTYENERALSVDDLISGKQISAMYFDVVRREVEFRDKQLWKAIYPNTKEPQSLIILTSCNTNDHVLPDSPDSVVFYNTTDVGILHSGQGKIQSTQLI